MPYNPSVNAILRVKDHLNELYNSDKNVTFISDDARKLSMWIREGINFARLHPSSELYAKYASLYSKYKITLKNNNVVCVLRDVSPLEVHKQLNKMTIRDIVDGLGVVGALIEHKPEFVFFPDFTNDFDQMVIIEKYADKNGYKIIVNDVGITLTKTQT